MRRASLLAAACLALAAFTVVTSASASYNTPYKARSVSVPMATAYNQCTLPVLSHRPSLTVPACPPAQSSANNPTNIYTFGDSGSIRTGTATVKLEATTGDVKIKVASNKIFKGGGPYSGLGLTGTATVRVTDNGCGAAFDADCTVVDFPFPTHLDCTYGSCKSASSSANAVIPGAIHSHDEAIVDIGQVSILDEDGDAFARGGLIAGRSLAPAGFNAPQKSSTEESSMVPAYNKCTVPTVTHRPSLALPACAPALSSADHPANTYTFGQSGSGADTGWATVSLGRNAVNRDNVRVNVASKSIWKNGAPYSGDDLQVTEAVRMTDRGCGTSPFNVDCTTVDFVFPVALHCHNGSCRSVKRSWNAILPGALDRFDTANIELGQVSIVDEDADTVARSGLFVK